MASVRGVVLRGLVVAAASCAAVWGLWRFFVATATGQWLDQVAASSADLGQGLLWPAVRPVLDVVSVGFVVVALLAVTLVAALRRRWALALWAAVLVGGANVATQLLKVVLDRPHLDVTYVLANSLPSGHTTVAASVAAALLLVVPRRGRPWAAVLGAGYAAATGVSTLVGQWHRPSDVVAAVAVVLGWVGLVTAAAALAGSGGADRAVSEGMNGAEDGGGGAAVFLLVLGTIAAVAAGFALLSTRMLDAEPADRMERAMAYGGAVAAVVAACCVAFGIAERLVAAVPAFRAAPR